MDTHLRLQMLTIADMPTPDEHVMAQQISTYFFAGERQEARLRSAFLDQFLKTTKSVTALDCQVWFGLHVTQQSL